MKRAFILEYGLGKMEPEFVGVSEVLKNRGYEVILFTRKLLQRNWLPIDPASLYVADHPATDLVLKRMGITLDTNCYPESLRNFLERAVWSDRLKNIVAQESTAFPLFVKPKEKTKAFTGFLAMDQTDLYALNGSRNTELYCSEPVTWLAEYRYFINNGKIVGASFYQGDETIIPDQKVVNNAREAFERSPERTAGYSLDFGVMANGKTALVEWNDGYALGSYELDHEVYTDLILSRWEELMQKNRYPEGHR